MLKLSLSTKFNLEQGQVQRSRTMADACLGGLISCRKFKHKITVIGSHRHIATLTPPGL